MNKVTAHKGHTLFPWQQHKSISNMQTEDRRMNPFTYLHKYSRKNRCRSKLNIKTEISVVTDRSDSDSFDIYTENVKVGPDQDELQSLVDAGNCFVDVGEELLDNQEELKCSSDLLSSGILSTNFTDIQTMCNLPEPDVFFGVISRESSDFPNFFAEIHFKSPGLVSDLSESPLQHALENPKISRVIYSKHAADENTKQADRTLKVSSLTSPFILTTAPSGELKENSRRLRITKRGFHDPNASSLKFVVLVRKASNKRVRKPRRHSKCERKFSSNVFLDSHAKTHSPIKRFECSICKEKFLFESVLNRHYKVHFQNKVYSCKYCDESFNLQKDAILHRRRHLYTTTCLCSVCGKQVSKEYWWRHLMIHSEEKQYGCNICGKRFTFNSGLTRHLKVHSGEKEYICSVCNRGCSTKSSLKVHLLTHSKERRYQCSTCKRRFFASSTVYGHSFPYNEENPFSCALCRTSYCSKENFERHWMRHNDGKVFECTYCNRTFVQKSRFDKHLKIHTKQDSLPELKT